LHVYLIYKYVSLSIFGIAEILELFMTSINFLKAIADYRGMRIRANTFLFSGIEAY